MYLASYYFQRSASNILILYRIESYICDYRLANAKVGRKM